MKTLVEIYDNEQILNILTSYNEKPKKVIFLYDDSQKDIIHNPVVEKYVDAKVEYKKINEEKLYDILNEKDENTCFDIHGGNNLAIAIVAQMAQKNHLKLIYPNINHKELIFLQDGEIKKKALKLPKLTVKEIVELYGASVRDLPEVHYDEVGKALVGKCMKIKRKNNKRWVAFCKILSGLNKKYYKQKGWYLEQATYRLYHGIFEELDDMFNISLDKEKDKYRISFKNDDYKPLVTDTGVAFEYDTYYQMIDSNMFDDVDIRVNIDWNGEPFNREDPNSELDVMATKDGRLISVSCKSGKYDQQAIYEVKSNANKFGGESAISVLCTDLDVGHKELVKKAEGIGVLLVEHEIMRDKTFVENLMEWIQMHPYK